MEIDKYIESIVEENYVYFIYSNTTNKIYVGETENIERINIYKSIIEEKDESKRFMLYNFYTKHNQINKELSYDIANKYNNFNIYFIRTKYKHLVKTYIRFLLDNNKNLYNKLLYKNHKYNSNEIELDFLKMLNN